MPDDPTNFRMERIEKLLYELRYECERGMLEREIGEEITYEWIIPMSSKIPGGVVLCRFRTKPEPGYMLGSLAGDEPRLRIVK